MDVKSPSNVKKRKGTKKYSIYAYTDLDDTDDRLGKKEPYLPCTIRANIAVANKFLNHSLRIFLSDTQRF